MSRRHYTYDNSSESETSPSDIIEIVESPIKPTKKKKKSFSFDFGGKASRKSKAGSSHSHDDTSDRKSDRTNKHSANTSGKKEVKKETSSETKTKKGVFHPKPDDSDSSDEEIISRKPTSGKRPRRGLAKRLYGSNQSNVGTPTGTSSEDGWYNATKSKQLPASQSSCRPGSKLSINQPLSTVRTYSFTDSDTDVGIKSAEEPPHKKRLTYHDSDAGSEGFEPSFSGDASNTLSPSDSNDDLFLTQTPTEQKSLKKLRVAGNNESMSDSDATVIEDPEAKDETSVDSDVTLIDSPEHDTQLPNLTLRFMSSSSEEEDLESETVHTSRQKSESSVKRYRYGGGRQCVDKSTLGKTTSNVNKDGKGDSGNSADSQESQSLFGNPPSLSQHINPYYDPYKFPSQSQDKTQSMPHLERISSFKTKFSARSSKRQEIEEQETTTDSEADVPLMSLAQKKKSTSQLSSKRSVESVIDEIIKDSEVNPSKRMRTDSYSDHEAKDKVENEAVTQNYSSRTGPNTTSDADDDKNDSEEILIPKTEPPSYGYTQDLDVVFIEESDSDYEDMTQKIVEISSDEDDTLQVYDDDVAEFRSYFNLSDCDSDDDRNVDDKTSCSSVSNIDWVTVDSDDDDFNYGLLSQEDYDDVGTSVYDQPTQVDTESKVRFIEKVVTFEDSDDKEDPYDAETQIDGADIGSHGEAESIYSMDTQLDDDNRPEVYIDVDGRDTQDGVHVKTEVLDSSDNDKDIDPFDLCVPVERNIWSTSTVSRPYKCDKNRSTKPSKTNKNKETKSKESSKSRIVGQDRVKKHFNRSKISSGYHIDPYLASTQVDMADVGDISEDVYMAQTQMDVTDNNMRGQNSTEDIYSAQTQIDSTVKVSKFDGDIYAAQTQIDGPVNVSEIDGEDIYTAQTQIDGPVNVSRTDGEDIYSAQTQIDGPVNVSEIDGEDIYSAQTQIDGAVNVSEINDEDIYSAQTQIDGAVNISEIDDDDIYSAQTQIDGAVNVREIDDEDIYSAQTQIDGPVNVSRIDDDDIYSAQTQIDGAVNVREIDDDNIYSAQTQIDGAIDVSESDDDDIYSALTQIDRAVNVGDTEEEDDIYSAQTQVDSVSAVDFDETDDDDIYLAQTQIDDTAYTSGIGDEDIYLAQTQIDDAADITISSGEDNRSTSLNNITISSTEDDEGIDIQQPKHGSKPSSTTRDKHSKLAVAVDTDLYSFPGNEYQDREKSTDSVKKLVPIRKTVLPTEPERLKSNREKAESFRIEKSTFYSKKSVEIPIQHSAQHKTNTSMNGWLSKSLNSKSQPKRKGSRSKKQTKVKLDNSQEIKEKMLEARAKMSKRKQSFEKPTAHRNTSTTVSTGFVTDVQLPNNDEIMSKQLPLLTMVEPALKHVSASLSSEKNDEKSSRPESGSSKEIFANIERTSSSGTTSSKTDSRNKERSASSRKDKGRSESSSQKERSSSSGSSSSRKDKEKSESSSRKERSQSSRSSSSRNDKERLESSSRKERSSSSGSSSNRNNKERSESSSRKERSPSSGSSSSRKDKERSESSSRKERSPSSGSSSSRNNKQGSESSSRKERLPSSRSSSSRSDKQRSESSSRIEHRKERSPSFGSSSSRKDIEKSESSSRKERSPSSGSSGRKDQKSESSSTKDHRKEKSSSSGSTSNRKDNKRSESSSNKDHKKERSLSPESSSNRKDKGRSESSSRKERSPSSGSSSSSKDKERSESSPSRDHRKDSSESTLAKLTPGSNEGDQRKEKMSSSSERPSTEDSRNKYSENSNKMENRDKKMLSEKESRSHSTENRSNEQMEDVLSLESVSEEETNFNEDGIPEKFTKEQKGINPSHAACSVSRSKENMPPNTTEVTRKVVFGESVNKPSTAPAYNLPVLAKPRTGKMIRRLATGPKSILTKSKEPTKKHGRNVRFTLPDKSPVKNPFQSRLARRIIAQKEQLPMNHALRRQVKMTKTTATINQPTGVTATVPREPQLPRPLTRQATTLPQPPRPQNLMQKCNAPQTGQMTRPLVDVSGTSNTPQIQQYSLDTLLVKLLQWNPVWLKEQVKCPFPPPAIEEENPLFSLGESFSSFDDYIRLFTPHILMETWETAVRGYKESVESGEPKHTVHLSAVQPSADKKFLHYTWNGVVSGDKFSTNQYLCDEDLVICNYMSEEWNPAQPGAPPHCVPRRTFGFLERVTHHRPQDVPRLYNDLPLLRKNAHALGNRNVATLKLKLKIRNGRNLRPAAQPATLQKVVSLIPIVRQYNALVELRRNILWRHILEPGRSGVFDEKQPVTDTLRKQLKNYNPSQQRAICTAAKIAIQPPNLPRICLLQGPPGTGKSHTIVGIIDKIIRDTNGQGRICLCTPSNAAVDEIIRRLMYHKMQMTRDQNQPAYDLHMVRIGKTSSIHKDVAKYTFSEVVHHHIQNEIRKKLKKTIPESSMRELDCLTKKISALSLELEQIKPGNANSVHKRRLQADLQKMEQKKADINQQLSHITKSTSLSPKEEYEIKKNILWRAHVICGTLSSFGSSNIQNLIRSRHPNDISVFYFNCIIMDEATQGTELDCLIPLQYGTSKLIMVGDPEQLSPTVLSRKAEEKCFGQSMFERMYGYYRYKDSSPVLLLDTQYRMNPEIVTFPSQYVYGGRLLSDRCTVERGLNFPLKPYLVFNIDQGQEQSSQAGSIKNEAEAQFVSMMCQHFIHYADIPQTDIGIITPYQRQKALLLEYLKQSKMTSIEVGTVDGFQGREKVVIIMSCVRASSSGGIGFVGNRKRMNVALTRARSAMYVVGNLSSLERPGGEWHDLIDDARKRNVIMECSSHTNNLTAIQACFKRLPS
ncbi:microtubule-associated protein futsch-like [Argopecten irradians]|uniref:microtubule-associated protein futsch-like n=1 Tax=Argopecten irradians TaxID=31199 RepID=UPI003714B588